MRFVRFFIFIFVLAVAAAANLTDFSDAPALAAEAVETPRFTVTSDAAVKSRLSLRDGREAASVAETGASQVQLTTADFDSDGVRDLVIAAENGSLRFLKGNSRYLTNPTLEPFTETGFAADAGLAPDFFEHGDFNADGNQDILAARRGDRSLVFLAGFGNGHFAAPAKIELGGTLTSLAVGEIGRADGQTDVAIGEISKKGAVLRVFEHPGGAFKHSPEVIALPATANFIATGFLGADSYSDIAVACGNRLVLVQGRGQVTPWDILRPTEIVRPKALVSSKVMAGNIDGLAIGQFTNSADLSVAILTSDGGVETLAPVVTEKTTNFADTAATDVKRKAVGFVPSGIDSAKTFATPDFANADLAAVADQIDPSMSPAEQRKIREEKFDRDAEELNKLSNEERAAFIANGKAEAAANDDKSRENFLKTVAAVPVDVAKWRAKTIIRDSRLASTNGAGIVTARVGFIGLREFHRHDRWDDCAA